jgi:diadenosine tetraphosphatase ApaH/serine/threonine PP2A family protein phosphatase
VKIAILGDIHANLEALTAVLGDAAAQGVSQYACTGDIVGYCANPHECLEIIRGLGCPVVMGNHDEEAARCRPITGMSDRARLAMEWTRENLTAEDKAWLASLPAVRQVRDFTVVHATLDSPKVWSYVMNRFDAMASFAYQFTRVCFIGHTHSPVVYVKTQTGVMRESAAEPIHIQSAQKYLINTGSVGMPRDGDPRAAYALYDIERAVVTIRRVPYDIEGAAVKVRRGPDSPGTAGAAERKREHGSRD